MNSELILSSGVFTKAEIFCLLKMENCVNSFYDYLSSFGSSRIGYVLQFRIFFKTIPEFIKKGGVDAIHIIRKIILNTISNAVWHSQINMAFSIRTNESAVMKQELSIYRNNFVECTKKLTLSLEKIYIAR